MLSTGSVSPAYPPSSSLTLVIEKNPPEMALSHGLAESQ
jgi:hypothetical protein